MVYSKRDSKKQETNGNADFRDHMAKNKNPTREQGGKKYFIKQERTEDVDAIKSTPYMKYQKKINGRDSRRKDYPVYNQKVENDATPRPIR
jgi:hypothetical protein